MRDAFEEYRDLFAVMRRYYWWSMLVLVFIFSGGIWFLKTVAPALGGPASICFGMLAYSFLNGTAARVIFADAGKVGDRMDVLKRKFAAHRLKLARDLNGVLGVYPI